MEHLGLEAVLREYVRVSSWIEMLWRRKRVDLPLEKGCKSVATFFKPTSKITSHDGGNVGKLINRCFCRNADLYASAVALQKFGERNLGWGSESLERLLSG